MYTLNQGYFNISGYSQSYPLSRLLLISGWPYIFIYLNRICTYHQTFIWDMQPFFIIFMVSCELTVECTAESTQSLP